MYNGMEEGERRRTNERKTRIIKRNRKN